MRRIVGALVVTALMLVGTAAFAGEDYGYYRDDFPDYIYNGSSGNLDWSNSPWQEYNDDGNVKTGAVHVDYTPEFCADEYKCLHLFGEGILEAPVGVKRYADISMMESAEFCFELTSTGELEGAIVTVYVTNGSGWVPVKTYVLPPEYDHPSFDVSDYISPEFGVRFELSGVIHGEVFIDSVEVKGSFESTSTTTSSTTTTTKPTTTTQPQTTTTKPRPTTSTSEATTTTTTERTTTSTQPTTTTTIPETTTTTESASLILPQEPPDGSGLRQTGAGLQFDHETGMNGNMSMEKPEVLGVNLTVDYKMAVEFIEQSWMWMVGLLLVIATAIVTGLDRRRARRFPESV